ncbi:MAG: tRNA uridine-5-carboxymethylaminomethyl(34) synthesis enzyme MnmG [Chlamydiales bacterium]|nr:tRNA uridine-5-carboxymethylaminomethyl(34) synthesis enzyme MnmG [Chlamydiales bacterium]
MVWKYPEEYDVIVIGGGHAGCEAAHASAKRGVRTLLLTMNISTIAQMSCNPSVGGIGKGHMVREIDALGGLMAKAIEATGIQFRMLNTKKGPAVQAPRAQADKDLYRIDVRQRLEKTPNLDIKQATCEELIIENGIVTGVISKEGLSYHGKTVIITSGTFMRGLLHMGDVNMSGGRAGDPPSVGLSASLEKNGIKLGRLKTGTPVRIHKRSVDYSLCEEQPGDEGVRFSFDEPETKQLPQVPCYITYTTLETKAIIQENLHRSPLYSGKIVGIGPRYCPSIEDKIVRFSDKDRHQLFLEPEGLTTEELYVNGVSSSLPFDVQYAFIRAIPSLRNAEIMRPGYAIEYDYITSGQMHFSLESTLISGLFFAGQINGTTGYEEAAAQGLMAGINAVQKIKGLEPVVLKRSEAYIGVMIDDLVTKGVDEPYRMFTSRAEHRLLLRHDNADLRLRRLGYDLGMISDEQMKRLIIKEEAIAKETERLTQVHKAFEGKNCTLSQLLARPELTYDDLLANFASDVTDYGAETNRQIELTIKYAGYIGRQAGEVEKLSHVENIRVPADLDFMAVNGLRTEAKLRLSKIRPQNLGQASRVPGIAPSDISVLIIALARREDEEFICGATPCA